jgi:hypothetical protein
LGLTLGKYLVARCRGNGAYTAWKFDGSRFSGDFNWRAIFNVERGQTEAETESATPSTYVEDAGEQNLSESDRSPALNWLWMAAMKEWSLPPSA